MKLERSDLAKSIEKNSFDQLAARFNETPEKLFLIMAAGLSVEIERSIKTVRQKLLMSDEEILRRLVSAVTVDQFRQLGEVGIIEAKYLNNLLEENTENFLDVHHHLSHKHFEFAIDNMRQVLSISPECQKLINISYIEESLALDKKYSTQSPKYLTDACINLLESCDVIFPHMAGFNAGVSRSNVDEQSTPIISMLYGIHDCLDYLTKHIVYYGSGENKEGVFAIYRNMRNHFNYYRARNGIVAILKVVTGEIFALEGMPYIKQLSMSQQNLAAHISMGGMDFVWFHEFAHVIVTPKNTLIENEMRCDEFAVRLIIASNNTYKITGMLLAVISLATIEYLSGYSPTSAQITHPTPLRRIQNILTVLSQIRGVNVLASLGYIINILDIPMRFFEEVLFKMEIRPKLEKIIDEALSPIMIENQNEFIDEFLSKTFEVYTGDENLLSMSIREGKPVQVIKFDIVAAIGLLASLAGGTLGATNPILIGLAILSCLASINSLVDKGSVAEGALFWIIYKEDKKTISRSTIKSKFSKLCKKNKELKSSDFALALQGLINFGAIEISGKNINVVEKFVITWTHE